MELISSTVLATGLFILVLIPGIVFLRALWDSKKGSLNAHNIYSYVIWGALVSIVVYSIALLINNAIIHDRIWGGWPHIPMRTIIHSVLHPNEKPEIPSQDYAVTLAIFFFATCILAHIIGRISSNVILWIGLDIKWGSLSGFRNDWFYLLSGRREKFSTVEEFYVIANLLSEVGDTVYIYTGQVLDYKLDGGETLEHICLGFVRMEPFDRPLSTPAPTTHEKITEDTIVVVEGDLTIDGEISVSGGIKVNGVLRSDKGLKVVGCVQANAVDVKGGFTAGCGAKDKNHKLHTSTKAPPIRIPGNVMVFKMSDIKNINLQYKPLTVEFD